MKPDFSEFSYGYAVTEELVAHHRASLVAAPLFPSLYDEGKAGGGYDVKIPISGTPVFLQFKLSDQLERKNAKENKGGLLSIPYFRMHIRPNKHSDQHNLLLALEASGETVYYIAPEFHRPEELNDYYLRSVIVANSAAFTPTDIGPMPDDEEHYMVFERGSTVAYRCSDRPLEVTKLNLHDGLRSILDAQGVVPRILGKRGLRELSQSMLSTLEASEVRLQLRQKTVDIEGVRRILGERSPVESASFIARTFFDSELLVFE